MKRLSLVWVALSFVLFSGCAQMENDVQLARRVFGDLCAGRQSAGDLVDWYTLKAIGVDIGSTYSQFRTEKDRTDYKKAFLYNFAASFKSSGGRSSQFFNWRIKSQDPAGTVVAADTTGQGRVILFTMSKIGKQRRLTAINWE